jgi:hypothetical protein
MQNEASFKPFGQNQNHCKQQKVGRPLLRDISLWKQKPVFAPTTDQILGTIFQ